MQKSKSETQISQED